VKFDDLLAAGPVDFYGVDNNTFRVGVGGEALTFEAVENESDGYRSMLEAVLLRGDTGVFSSAPFCRVTVIVAPESAGEYGYGPFDGYQLVDDSGHVWLTLGTDNYYPSFTFRYTPHPAVRP